MATVVDTITWATDEVPLKAYLGVTGSAEDDNLELWLGAATYAADDYMENPFVDSTGADVPQPPGVKLGVYEYVRATRKYYLSNAGGGLASVKTGQLAETYAKGIGGSPQMVMGKAALDAAAVHWRRNKIDLLIGGAI